MAKKAKSPRITKLYFHRDFAWLLSDLTGRDYSACSEFLQKQDGVGRLNKHGEFKKRYSIATILREVIAE